ncbi:uncharacterized protein LOC121611590 [Chelmon rostratus]|uniref:uncharacterized protein LOC121611590 n=1 Tax=Chelmon rostratus TaxID=109905 RepID=UPI001BE8E28B|nr:uncharacterized protein LOC121611590 [Chelmon rostratus]
MLLLYMTVSCVLLGSSAGIQYEEVCYGGNFRLPFDYTPPVFNGQLYFTPSDGGSRRIVMDNGKAQDPRFKVSIGSVQFTDLRERDDGAFSVSFDGNRIFDVISLKILDCVDEIRRNYGDAYRHDVPRQAEYLEFTPLRALDQTKVLWNRTDPQTNRRGRGPVKRNMLEIIGLTQADSGYYNFRKKDNTLLSRILLAVEGTYRRYDATVSKRLFIKNPTAADSWTVTLTPEGETEPRRLINAGQLEWSMSKLFARRITLLRDGIEIYPVESIDSGTFEFRDPQGNLAQTVQVEVVYESAPTFVYVGVGVGIVFAVIFCCCCVRKCCCKKSSSKRNESAPQTAAAPAVYYHDENQPTGPSYSGTHASNYSYQPMNPLVSREPATTSLGPPVYNPVNIHVNPPQPEVAAPGGLGAAPSLSLGSDCHSSDPEPKFELKGLAFPSAPPLSSDSAFCDVYTSDKLNFL